MRATSAAAGVSLRSYGPVILVFVLMAASACTSASQDASGAMSDARLIEIARNTAEATEFETKLGASNASVDRSGRLAVDLRSGNARLRVFIVNGTAVEVFLDCPPGTVHTRDVVSAIRACGG